MAEEQTLKINIVADAKEADRVLTEVEKRINAFASKVSETLKNAGNDSGKTSNAASVSVKVDRTSLDKLMEDLKKMGAGFTIPVRVDANMVANEMRNRVGNAAKDASKEIEGSLIDAMGRARDAAADMVSPMRETIPSWDPTYIDNLTAKIDQAKLDLQQYETELDNLGESASFAEQKATVDRVTGAYDKLLRLLEQYAAQNVGGQSPKVASDLDNQRNKVDALKDSLAGYQRQLAQDEAAGKNTASIRAKIASATERLKAEQSKLNGMMAQQSTIYVKDSALENQGKVVDSLKAKLLQLENQEKREAAAGKDTASTKLRQAKAAQQLEREEAKYRSMLAEKSTSPNVADNITNQQNLIQALTDKLLLYQNALSGAERAEQNTAGIRLQIAQTTARLAKEQEKLNNMLNPPAPKQPKAKNGKASKKKQAEEEAAKQEDLFSQLQEGPANEQIEQIKQIIKAKIDEVLGPILSKLKKIGGVFGAIGKAAKVVGKVIGTIISVVTKLFSIVKKIFNFIKSVLKIVFEIVKAVVKVYATLAKVSAVIVGGVIAGMGKAIVVLGKMCAVAGKAVFEAFAAPFKLAGNLVKSLWEKIKGLWSRLKSTASRLLFRKAIQGIVSAIEEGFDALAEKSSSAKTNLGMLKGAFKGVGASISTAFSPFIAAATATLMRFAKAIVAAMNAASRFFGTLFGVKYSVVSLTEAVDDLGSSTSGAGSAAKGALADFDELNVLTQNSGGGGSGGSSSSGFTIKEVEGGGFGSKLAELFNNDSFEEAGKFVNEWASGLLDKINVAITNWDSTSVGKHIAEFFNGLTYDTETFKKFGETLSLALLRVLQGINSFLDTNDGGQTGKAIVAFINGLTMESTLHELASTIKKFIVEECEIMGGMFTGEDRLKVGTKLATFINDIFGDTKVWGDVGTAVYNMITWAIGEGIDLLTGLDFVAIGDSFQAFLQGLNLDGCAVQLSIGLKKALVSATELATKLLTVENVTIVATAIANLFNNLFSNEDGTFTQLGTNIATALNNTIKGLNKGLKAVHFADIGTTIGGFLSTVIVQFDAKAFGETLHTLIMGAITFLIGDENGGGLLNSTDFNGVGTKITELLGGLKLGEIGGKLGETASKLIVSAVENGIGLLRNGKDGDDGGIISGVENFINNIKFSDDEIKNIESFGAQCKKLLLTVLSSILGSTNANNGDEKGLKDGINAFLNGLTFSEEDTQLFIDALSGLLERCFKIAWEAAKKALNTLIFGEAIDVSGWKLELSADDFEINLSDDAAENLWMKYNNTVIKAFMNGSILPDDTGTVYATIKASLEKSAYWDNMVQDAIDYTIYLKDNPGTTFEMYLKMKGDAGDENAAAAVSLLGGANGKTVLGKVVPLDVMISAKAASNGDEVMLDRMAVIRNYPNSKYAVTVSTKKGVWNTAVEKIVGTVAEIQKGASELNKVITVGFGGGSATPEEVNAVAAALKTISGINVKTLAKKAVISLTGLKTTQLEDLAAALNATSSSTDKEITIETNGEEVLPTIKETNAEVKTFNALPKEMKKKLNAALSGTSPTTIDTLRKNFEKLVSKDVNLTVKSNTSGYDSKKVSEVKDNMASIAGKTVNLTVTGSIPSAVQKFLDSYNKLVNKKVYVQGSLTEDDLSPGGKALGGTVGAGTLFYAGEAGPEVVADLGGGTSGIMNVKQMATAVSNGVAMAMHSQNKILAEQNKILKALLSKDLIISPSAELGQVVSRSEILYGKI